MKMLSIKQPWASLICAGVRDVENRTWQTKYRGRLGIHASGDSLAFTIDTDIPEDFYRRCVAQRDAGQMDAGCQRLFDFYHNVFFPFYGVSGGEEFREKYSEKMPPFFVGRAIVGEVDLVDIVRDSASPWANAGCYHWILQNAVLYDKPILSVQGKLGIWSREV